MRGRNRTTSSRRTFPVAAFDSTQTYPTLKRRTQNIVREWVGGVPYFPKKRLTISAKVRGEVRVVVGSRLRHRKRPREVNHKSLRNE